MSPLANSYLTKEQLDKKESYYPLKVVVCDKCLLVQLPAFETSEHIFEDYDYFSSFSSTMLKHSQKYVDTISKRLKLTESSFAVEVASNDGYLLQYFNKKGIPNVGIEPAKNVAKVANEKGVNTESFFFGRKICQSFY